MSDLSSSDKELQQARAALPAVPAPGVKSVPPTERLSPHIQVLESLAMTAPSWLVGDLPSHMAAHPLSLAVAMSVEQGGPVVVAGLLLAAVGTPISLLQGWQQKGRMVHSPSFPSCGSFMAPMLSASLGTVATMTDDLQHMRDQLHSWIKPLILAPPLCP